ncbi:MAG TPA: ABC transporter permease [Candidatus Acidoferrales bacterium]|nr:ABC transporter permease [Candidatus Acidoferrales bacterium]
MKEDTREAWSFVWLEQLLQDFGFALRMLARNPGFAVVVILMLALGIGANSAVFTFAEAALLRSWPAKSPESLAKIVATTPQGGTEWFSYPDYRDLSEQCQSLEGIVAWSRHQMTLRVGAESQFVLDDWVSPNYFTVLSVHAQLGRTLSETPDPTRELIVVISDALWHRVFNADPNLVGKPILLTGKSYTVIGIAPPRFRGLQREVPTDLWLPVSMESASELQDRAYHDFELLGRLRPGVTATEAKAEFETIGRRLAEAYPSTNKATTFTLVSESERLRDALFPTFMLMTAVGLVLLICCANVAGLVLARTEMRHREIAVRLALGAGRGRLVRLLLTESALLASVGAGLGLLLASWLLRLQPALLPPAPFEIGLDLRLDSSVLAFTLVAAALTVILFGLVPALPAANLNLIPALKPVQSGPGPARRFGMRNVLVLGEIALSVVLLTASGLLVRSLVYSRGLNAGFDTRKSLVFFDLSPGLAGYNAEASLRFFQQAAEKVGGLTGVRRASFARRVLLSDSEGGAKQRVSIPGVELPQGQPNVPIKFNAVGLDYFATLGTRLIEGRDFRAADGPSGARVVVISETMARRFWPGKNALGQQIVADGKDFQIIGVAEDAKIIHIHEAPEPYMYFPFAQSPINWGTLIVETRGDPRTMVAAIRREIGNVDQNVPVGVRTLNYLLQQAFWEDQTAAGFVGALGMMGMFMAATGLYGLISFLVNRRRHEIGIRMALGAERRDVLRLVLSEGLRLAGIGIVVGCCISLGVTRLMSGLLYGVRPRDPITFATSSAVVILIALVASYIPARRAMRVDPMVALRYE